MVRGIWRLEESVKMVPILPLKITAQSVSKPEGCLLDWRVWIYGVCFLTWAWTSFTLKLDGNYLFVKLFVTLHSKLTMELWWDRSSFGRQTLWENISVILLISQVMLNLIQKSVGLEQSKYKESSRKGLHDCGKENENIFGDCLHFRNLDEIERDQMVWSRKGLLDPGPSKSMIWMSWSYSCWESNGAH